MDGDARPSADTVDLAQFEGVGVPPRVAWLASAALYGTASAIFIVLPLVSDSAHIGVAALGAFGLFMACFCVVGARWFTDAWWGGHVRSTIGMGIVVAGSVVIGEALTATSLIMLFPMVTASFLFDWRRALPYACVAVGYFYVALSLTGDPSAHAVVTGTVVAALATAILASQYELRTIVRVNRDLSVTDALTGAANVRRLHAELDEALATGDRQIALFAIDLDDFKLINDRFSHARGDAVLKAVAEEINAVIASDDLLARRGGDEFSVLIADASDRDLEGLRDELRAAINRARVKTCPEVNPNGSVAFVIRDARERSQDLLERGDAALHESKLEAHPERRVRRLRLVGKEDDADRRNTARSDHLVGGTASTIAEELTMARTIHSALGGASAWRVLSVTAIAAAVAILGALATKTGATLNAQLPLVAAIGLIALGLLAALGSRRHTGRRLMHAYLAASIALISLAAWSSGPLSASMADLYLLPIIGAVYAFHPRRLPFFLAVCLGLFAATLFATDYAYPVTRLAVTGVIILAITALLAKARRLTHEFTKHAVELSTVDALTGVANLRGMRRGVATAIEHCEASGQTLVLVSVDLDEFKLVNDLYSHTMGDRVLMRAANAMVRSVRETDLIARRGGDEFTAVCVIDPDQSPARIRAALREAIRAERAALTPEVSPTASIGSVAWRPGENVDEFLARADEELHFAKMESHSIREAAELKTASPAPRRTA
ncbi:MAG: diguanylate cyclase [Actinobacteria bacterium]|nr:diguanylate cyclase [Actinomycetota bacterium]